MSDRALVALTGGTGFVGRHLLEHLVKAGYRVDALTRRAMPDMPGVAWRPGDLADDVALEGLVERADAVIHVAGLIKARTRAEFFRVNQCGTAAVLAAAERTGVKRFVHMSSLAATAPEISDYAASKKAAEAVVESALAPERRLIVRIPAVYGPGDTETLKIFKVLKLGLAPMPLTRGRFAMIHVADLCSAVIAALDYDGDQRTVGLDDGVRDGYSLEDIYREAMQALGKAPVLLPVPRALVRLSAGVNAAFAKLRGTAAIFSPGKARELLDGDWVVRGARFDEITPWAPQTSLAEGLRDTLAWYRRAGWL